jgi:hypothetical protein
MDRIGWRSLAAWLHKAALLRAAQRTLDTRADLLPPFQKLVHPYGICLRGRWHITHETPYTGYFASAREALIIARASDAMNETRPGKLRFLGLAAKLYPTADAHHPEPLQTANFFALENLAGSHSERFSEATLYNDLLPLIPQPGAARYAALANVVGPTFMLADRALMHPSQPMIRQLYPIAELGELHPERAQGPRYMKLVGVPQAEGPHTSDLRKELAMHEHPDGVRFEIHVADASPRLLPKAWQRIGEIHFTESVASRSGDTRLHFAHPRYHRGRAEHS